MHRFTCIFAATFSAALAPAQSYLFTIDTSRTYTEGTAIFRLYTGGTLIGNYDAVNNPGGTRTKPGLFGLFEPGENKPVLVGPFFQIAGSGKYSSSGTFKLSVDSANRRATLSQYNVNRLANGPLHLGTTVALNNEAFRTKSPDFAFPDHLPPVRLGRVTIDKLTVKQRDAMNTGVLQDRGAGTWRVIVTFMATMEMNVVQFGQSTPIVMTVPYSLVGDFKDFGGTGVFKYDRGQGGENLSITLNYSLDPFELGFDTGTGSRVGFVMALAIKRFAVSISGTRQFYATGT